MFEWADGGNLRNLWNTIPSPNRQPHMIKATIEQLLGLTKALCALHYFDSKGSHYRHGDLKPDNILWYQNTVGSSNPIGTLKIGDWGIAKGHNLVTEDRPYKTTTPYRTRRYEAPEVVTGVPIKYEGQATGRRSLLYDIWVMGCITLEFVVWLLYGTEGLKEFNKSIDGPLQGDTPFYDINKGELGAINAVVHSGVLKQMDHMAKDPACQKYTTALGDLLDLVRTGLLVVRLPRSMGSNRNMGIDEPPMSPNSSQIKPELIYSAPDDTILENRTISQEASLTTTPALLVTPADPAERIPVPRPKERAGDYRLRADLFRDRLERILDEDNGDSYWLTGASQPPDSVSGTISINSSQTGTEARLMGKATDTQVDATPAKGRRNSIESVSSVDSIASVESFWSAGFTQSSESSYGELGALVTLQASRKLADVLWENGGLHSLYVEASTKFDRNAFARKHDGILKGFFEDLRAEVTNAPQLGTVRLLRHKNQRKVITDSIYTRCSSASDTGTLLSQQALLDQSDDGDEMLNRFIRSHTAAADLNHPVTELEYSKSRPYDDGGNNNDDGIERLASDDENGNDDSDGNGESDDSEGNSEDENIEQPRNDGIEELNAVVAFLTKSSSFEQLRVNLYSVVYPESAICEALRSKDVKILQSLLTKRFDRVCAGDYAWIKELRNAGYTAEDIAQLLFEEATDSPWIYFDGRDLDDITRPCEMDYHAQGCIHHYFDNGHVVKADGRGSPLLIIDDDSTGVIEELCGLAGIVPTSRNKDDWNGCANFSEDGSTVEVTYAANNVSMTARRAMLTLKQTSLAIGYVQASGHCCDTFTAPIHRKGLDSDLCGPTNPIHLHQVSVKAIMNLLSRLETLIEQDSITRSDIEGINSYALAVLGPFGPQEDLAALGDGLHNIALAAQFASLAFLSYNQAHVGPIQPFFLDKPQRRVLLLGVSRTQSEAPVIVADLADITCIASMIKDRLIAFNIHGAVQSKPALQNIVKYDLTATPEDLLDTWGPGNFIVPTNQMHGFPSAIRLCNGIVHCISESDLLFHWTSDSEFHAKGITLAPVKLGPTTRVRIGALVTVNQNCENDELEAWNRSHSAFEILGVQEEYWQYDESQFGLSGGQYVVLQHNRTKHKVPGRTLKNVILDRGVDIVLHVLNDLWGLQVSFCTGVNRRVPLRTLMADLLPVVGANFPGDQESWDELDMKYKILEGFKTDAVLDLFKALPKETSSYILSLMRKILVILEPTGIDPEGKSFVIAWIYDRPPFRCFKVPCVEKKNSWARVIADSGDCATFAYITTTCLESSTFKCRGPASYWHNTAPLLETAILRYNENPSRPLGPLEDKKTYFFQKSNDFLQVNVERREPTASGGQGASEVALYVQSSYIPAKFRQRVQRMEFLRKKDSRIRERRESREVGAEQVAILTHVGKL